MKSESNLEFSLGKKVEAGFLPQPIIFENLKPFILQIGNGHQKQEVKKALYLVSRLCCLPLPSREPADPHELQKEERSTGSGVREYRFKAQLCLHWLCALGQTFHPLCSFVSSVPTTSV